MEKEEVFTDKCTGSHFCELATGLVVNETKAGKLFYVSSSALYPKGYISDDAAAILDAQMAKADCSTPDKEDAALRSAISNYLEFANIHTDNGDVIPALIKKPEAPKRRWGFK